MVNRPAGGARSTKYPREPFDYYREPPWVVGALFDMFDFGDDLIWDPSCGGGNILDVAHRRGHPVFGSDIVDRPERDRAHPFAKANFLRVTRHPELRGRRLRIINNPPYSYEDDIAERFIRKALDFPVAGAAFVVPIAFLSSAGRYGFFTRDLRPSHVAICTDRPTMPPGSRIEAMGPKAYEGGMSDYVWIIYRPPHRSRTETVWLKPRAESAPDPRAPISRS